MTDKDVVDALKATFQGREELVSGRAGTLLPEARRRWRRQRRWKTAGVAMLVTVVTAGIGVAVLSPLRYGLGPADSAATGPTMPPAEPGRTPELTHDWVWHSALGLQFGAPGGWGFNDYGCNQTAQPSVVHADGYVWRDCFTPEPSYKNLVVVGTRPERQDPNLTARDIVISGVPATLKTGQLKDGRYAAELAIPSRQVYLTVRTVDVPERDEIVRTAHLVDVDYLGCATGPPPSTTSFAPAGPLSSAGQDLFVRVCAYLGANPAAWRLTKSGQLSAEAANAFAAAANAAPEFVPSDQCGQSSEYAALVLVMRGDEVVARLWILNPDGCGPRMDTGSRKVSLTTAMATALGEVPTWLTDYGQQSTDK
jgi:hypothetical protein